MKKISNPFHMTSMSPWPMMLSVSLLSMIMMMFSLMKNNMIKISLMFMIPLSINMFLWWKDIKRESSFQGHHSIITMKMLKFSMIMFIMSEIMFFLSFFWAFFHSSISPNVELGMTWPPKSINVFNAMSMPLMNSMILLSSGATITWSHHLFMNKNIKLSLIMLLMTILMGVMFSMFQMIEYYYAKFSFSDSSYGSTFFMATGFHGIHVIIGSMFLTTSMKNLHSLFNSSYHFISMDLSAWYWHFVDVVWLFLFTSMYWWGSM